MKILFLFFFLISRVHAWTTVSLSYGICNMNFTETVSFELVNPNAYGTSNFVNITSNKIYIELTMNGCNSDSSLGIALPRNSEKNQTVLGDYVCGSGYRIQPTVTTSFEYDGPVPDSNFPMPQ